MTIAPAGGPLVVAYLGNFEPAHSTENHLTRAWEANGHEVVRLQENDPASWALLPYLRADLVLWTHTWSYQLDPAAVTEALSRHRRHGTPIVAYHLDRLWGLDREHLVATHPFFVEPDIVVTADGGHDLEWARAGITHRWLPPAVDAAEAASEGRKRAIYSHPVVFVGSWSWYHAEWPWRLTMVQALTRRYGRRFACWPQRNTQAVRGQALNDLYASATVVVGDSCLAGSPGRYWSDRVPETIGRGGALIHPDVPGMAEAGLVAGQHFAGYALDENDSDGSLLALYQAIDRLLEDHDLRKQLRLDGRAEVLAHHTYDVRVRQLVALLVEDGLL